MLNIKRLEIFDRIEKRHKTDNIQSIIAICLAIASLIGLFLNISVIFPDLKYLPMAIPFLTYCNPTLFCSLPADNAMLTFEPISITIVALMMIVAGGLFFGINSQALKGNKIVIILASICVLLSVPEAVIIIIASVKTMINYFTTLSGGINATTLAIDVVVSSFIVLVITITSAVNKLMLLAYAIMAQVAHVEITRDEAVTSNNTKNSIKNKLPFFKKDNQVVTSQNGQPTSMNASEFLAATQNSNPQQPQTEIPMNNIAAPQTKPPQIQKSKLASAELSAPPETNIPTPPAAPTTKKFNIKDI